MKYRLVSALTIIGSVALWQLVCHFQFVSALYLPSPTHVLKAFVATYPGILRHAGATFLRAIGGVVFGSGLGALAGFLMNWNKWLGAVLDPIVESIRSVPAIAAIPFFILWFGTGNIGQVLLTTLACAVVFAVDVYVAIRNVPPIYIRAAQSMGAGKFAISRYVLLPAITPDLTAGLRIIAAISFTMTIADEFMGAQLGLGYLIMRARRSLETQTMLLCMILIGILARAIDVIIRFGMDRINRWSETSTEALRASGRGTL
jgi:taurine transport system permease protein